MNELFAKWFKDDDAAIMFARVLWTAMQEWDDLQDEGKCENHNSLLSWLAFGKEYTPYFAANSAAPLKSPELNNASNLGVINASAPGNDALPAIDSANSMLFNC